MTIFARVLGAFLLLGLNATVGPTAAEDLPDPVERFAGETRIEAQPPLPIHLEFHPVGDAVGGAVSIPMGGFELFATQQGGSITGRFEGPGGEGSMSLVVDGDRLTGAFTLGEAKGTISARRTDLDAQTFFLPPEEKLDLTTAEWIEDLDRLVEILTQEHASPFHTISRERFEKEATRIRHAIPNLTGIDVALEFRKLGALIGDGHTEVELPQDQSRLPVELFWFEDGLRVVGVSAEHRQLLRSRLVTVGAVAVEDAIERLRPFIAAGETEGFVQAGMPAMLANPDVLAAAGVASGPSIDLTFEAADGHRTSIGLVASPDPGEWATLDSRVPLWRRNDTQGFWREAFADGSIYVNWRSYDQLADHTAALLQDLDAQHPRRLIIDLRDNTGGDYNAGRAFIEEIRSRPWLDKPGVLYVLVGRATFSAAMTNAVDFKTTTNAILAGEPAGAAPNNWQEVRRFHLPNSGLPVGVSTLRYEFLPGETELRPDLSAWPEPSDWGADQDASVRLILAQP